MTYVQDVLMQDETIIFETRSHKVLLLITIISFILGLSILLPFINWITSGNTIMSQNGTGLKMLISAAVFLLMGIHRYVLYKTSEFALTNKRVIARFGFFQQVSIDLNIDKIQGIVVDQGLGGRIFNYGTVKVVGVGVNERIPFIPEPLKFRKIIQENISQ